MPFNIEFDNGITRTTLHGVIVPDDVASILEQTFQYEANTGDVVKRLTLFGEVSDFQVKFTTLFPISVIRRNQILGKEVRSAFVASNPTEFGFTRMWQSLVEGPNLRCQIFETLEEAELWLDQI